MLDQPAGKKGSAVAKIPATIDRLLQQVHFCITMKGWNLSFFFFLNRKSSKFTIRTFSRLKKELLLRRQLPSPCRGIRRSAGVYPSQDNSTHTHTHTHTRLLFTAHSVHLDLSAFQMPFNVFRSYLVSIRLLHGGEAGVKGYFFKFPVESVGTSGLASPLVTPL
jgi:hypothetical protein